jgi:hypothetical protein
MSYPTGIICDSEFLVILRIQLYRVSFEVCVSIACLEGLQQKVAVTNGLLSLLPEVWLVLRRQRDVESTGDGMRLIIC